MSPLQRLWNLLRRARIDDDLQQEIETHLALIEDEERAHGSNPEQARLNARSRFGNARAYRERAADAVIARSFENAVKDTRHAVRMLWKRPGFTAVAILSLALGVGVNTAMFSVINTVLLRPLPYPRPEQLVRLAHAHNQSELAIREFEAARDRSRAFAFMSAYRAGGERRLDSRDRQDWVTTLAVSADFLRTLEISLRAGRDFDADEMRTGGPAAVIITEDVWRRVFRADPAISGQAVTLDGAPYTVAGVLPADFWFPQRVDALVPLRPNGNLSDLGTNTQVLARLKTGVALRQAQIDISDLTDDLVKVQSNTPASAYRGLSIVAFRDWLVGDVRLNLLLLFGATAVLLLIACANLAMLLMTRFAGRRKEIALRMALGSGRRRLVAQFLLENFLLAGLGLVASVFIASGLIRGLVAWLPFNLPAATPIRLDLVVLGFSVAVAAATAAVFTLVPLLISRRLNVQDALLDRSAGPDHIRARTGNVLVIVEVALSSVLLVAASLLIQSLYRMHQEQLGFVPGGLITFVTPIDRTRLPSMSGRTRFTNDVRKRLEQLPDVRGVAAIDVLPLTGQSNLPTQRDGNPDQSIGGMEIRTVTPNYFELMGIPLRHGRSFTREDGTTSLPVAIINETLAHAWWPGGNPVGDRVVIGLFRGKKLTGDSPREIVGVVGDTKTMSLKQPPRPTVFIPVSQGDPSSLAWIVRADGSPALASQLRTAVAAVDRSQRVLQVRTLSAIVDSTTATPRFNASLFVVFAGVAFALSVIGLYGVVSFLVAERRHEIGTRMALGAARRDVLRLFMRHGVIITVAGLGIGLAAALLAGRWLSTLLYGVRPNDALTFAAVAALLFVVGITASYVPARRAAKTDPMAALRSQ